MSEYEAFRKWWARQPEFVPAQKWPLKRYHLVWSLMRLAFNAGVGFQRRRSKP